MNPLEWTEEERRAFWVGLWANAALVVVLALILRRRAPA